MDEEKSKEQKEENVTSALKWEKLEEKIKETIIIYKYKNGNNRTEERECDKCRNAVKTDEGQISIIILALRNIMWSLHC